MTVLYFEKLSMFQREQEPCSVAVPFARGVLTNIDNVSVLDGIQAVPTQTRVTATWPDGSVKWLLAHFLADLPANQGKRFTLSTESFATLPSESVTIDSSMGSRIVIRTGAIEVELSSTGETGLFHSVRRTGHVPVRDIVGPSLRDAENDEYVCEISAEGWQVLESGPVRSVVETRGRHLGADGKRWFDFVSRIYAFAGKPWLIVDYQIINKEVGTEATIHAAEMCIRSVDGGDSSSSSLPHSSEHVRLGINRTTTRREFQTGSAGENLSLLFTAENLKQEFIEDIAETFCGTFWADVNDSRHGGMSVSVFQAQQNIPKSLEVSADEIVVGIIPTGHPITMLQGMAKTHRLFLHDHSADETLEQVNVRSLQFQMPDHPILESEAYERAGFIEPMDAEQKLDWVERAFYRLADGSTKTFGMLHWGDAPDQAYTNQGRGNGDWVWVNNEYDLPHAAMHLFARTGRRRFYDYMLRGAEHWKDVDICHFSDDPLRYQGQIMHSGWHATGEVKICHEWVEGLLDYYHTTGELSALEAAIGIGDNVMRNLATPRYQSEGGISARESGWALRSLGALYNETYDEKWLQAADQVVDHFEIWMNKYGAWLSPAAGHTVFRSVFMTCIAVNSLMRYYRIRPQERIKRMVVHAMEDLLEHCYLEDVGMFYYKELPSTQRLHGNPISLEALSYAYEFTGDLKFLQAGQATFLEGIEKMGKATTAGSAREITGNALIFWGASPKLFAQYYYPMYYYYRTAIQAGLKL